VNSRKTDTRAVRKVTFSELLTKQGMRKKFIVHIHTYIHKLLLNIVAAGIEALVSRISFVCLCQRSFPPVSLAHSDTFHQLLIIVEVLSSQPLLQVGKQAVVTQS
jgi:hypothetical protein